MKNVIVVGLVFSILQVSFYLEYFLKSFHSASSLPFDKTWCGRLKQKYTLRRVAPWAAIRVGSNWYTSLTLNVPIPDKWNKLS